MAELTELLDRVRNAHAPDRELDAAIALACGAVVEPAERDSFGAVRVPAWWTMPNASREEWPHRTTPWPLTASIDAAVGLFNRFHGADGWELELGVENGVGCARVIDIIGETCCTDAFVHKEPACAVIAALLSSLLAQEAHADE